MVLAQSSSSFVTNSTTNNNGNHYRNSSRNSTSPPASLSMTTVDSVNGLLTVTKWAIENDVFLSDFVERYALPHLVVVTKGQCLSVGAPNIANPSLKPYVLIHSRQKMRKCLAQVMRTKDGGRRAVVTDQKIAIPETFSGFFEILSEDLKPVKCCESVAELAQKFPEMALVRAACKAYLPESDGELRNLYRTRSVQEGEVLTLVGKFNYKRSQFLRCFDENGNSLYLKWSQRGRFSPIARAEAITGVHVIKNLLHAKRFPLTVRLIQGDFPAGLAKTGHSLVLRLLSGFTEDSVVVYTLQREPEMLSVPMNAYLKVAPSSNYPQVVARPEFQWLTAECDVEVPKFASRITPYYDELPANTSEMHRSSNPAIQDSGNQPQQAEDDQVNDEEIDQLYDYIRGLGPLPSKSTPSPTKPSPPPLETLPSKKSGTESGTNSKSPPRHVQQQHYPVKHSPAEKRLDKVIYGLDEMHITPTDRSKQLRKSQSNDRLNELEIIPAPNPVAEPPRLLPQRRAIKPVARAKPRPLSMVLPDHVQVFAPHPPEYFAGPTVWSPGPPPPPHHPMISHFNHSFVNLHAPPAHVHLPDPYGPPPPYHGGFGMQRKAWNPYEGYPV